MVMGHSPQLGAPHVCKAAYEPRSPKVRESPDFMSRFDGGSSLVLVLTRTRYRTLPPGASLKWTNFGVA